MSEPTKPDGAGLLGSTAELIRVIGQSPAAGFLLLGGAITFASVIRKIGNYDVQIAGSEYVGLSAGSSLLLIGIIWTVLSSRAEQRRIDTSRRKLQEIGPDRKLPDEAYDLDFMMKVFYLGMPPAFVKRVEPGAASTGPIAVDILYSKRYVRFQDSPETVSISNGPRHDAIWQDHRAGDERALRDGTSIQLEYPGSYVNGKLRPILTYKTRITHGTNSYIVGWYIPIDRLDEIPPGIDRVHLRQEIDQVKFRLSISRDKSAAITAELGQALKDTLSEHGAQQVEPLRQSQIHQPENLRP